MNHDTMFIKLTISSHWFNPFIDKFLIRISISKGFQLGVGKVPVGLASTGIVASVEIKGRWQKAEFDGLRYIPSGNLT